MAESEEKNFLAKKSTGQNRDFWQSEKTNILKFFLVYSWKISWNEENIGFHWRKKILAPKNTSKNTQKFKNPQISYTIFKQIWVIQSVIKEYVNFVNSNFQNSFLKKTHRYYALFDEKINIAHLDFLSNGYQSGRSDCE